MHEYNFKFYQNLYSLLRYLIWEMGQVFYFDFFTFNFDIISNLHKKVAE